MKTTPNPPSPICSSSLYRPMIAPADSPVREVVVAQRHVGNAAAATSLAASRAPTRRRAASPPHASSRRLDRSGPGGRASER